MAGTPIAAGLSAIGSLIGGIGALFAGNAKAKALRQGAEQTRQEAGVAASIAMEEGDRVVATAATRAAASGGGITGSASAVLQDLSRQATFNARSAIYRGATKANALEFEGRVARAQGKLDFITGAFRATSTVLGGMGQTSLNNAGGGGGSGGGDDLASDSAAGGFY